MLTNEELIAVATAAREAIRVELVEMWGMPDVHLSDALTPGVVRAVVDVLSRDCGVVRADDMGCMLADERARMDQAYRARRMAAVEKIVRDDLQPPQSVEADAPKPTAPDLADHWPALEQATPDPEPEPEPAPLTNGPGRIELMPTGPRVSLPLVPKPPTNGNGHSPAKRPANLDVPPVPLPAAPPKRPASAWAKKLDITGDLASVVGQLETGETSWRTLDNEQRRPIVLAVLNWMRARGWRLTQADADTHRPPWMPTSQAWVMALSTTWSDLVADATREAGL